MTNDQARQEFCKAFGVQLRDINSCIPEDGSGNRFLVKFQAGSKQHEYYLDFKEKSYKVLSGVLQLPFFS